MPARKSRAATSSPSVADDPLVEESGRALANLLPEAAQDAGRLPELGRRDFVLVDGLEEKRPHC